MGILLSEKLNNIINSIIPSFLQLLYSNGSLIKRDCIQFMSLFVHFQLILFSTQRKMLSGNIILKNKNSAFQFFS